MKDIKVLILSSEMAPLAKSGGLGDVIGSLPIALRQQNIDARVVFPKYKSINLDQVNNLEQCTEYYVNLGWRKQSATIYRYMDPFPTYLIENSYYFDRDGFYGYHDDFERFAFFTKAAIEMMHNIDFKADIIHFNDWQTGLGSIYLKDKYKSFTFYQDMKTVYTIHNLQYQGIFGKEIMENIDLDTSYCTFDKLEFFSCINYMKGGITYADAITTVSEKYSLEIQTPEYGYNLDGLLSSRKNIISGIVNGINTDIYNPEKNPYIYKHYNSDSIHIKKENKTCLQEELGLPIKDVPIISIVSRLADQKGLDILQQVIYEIMNYDIQFIVVGTGEVRYEHLFYDLAYRYPDKFSANIKFSEDLAQKVYAGSDLFLMPSLFEPCGLGQLIAMSYGTIPIVRNTGGLSDTVKHGLNGFVFNDYDGNGLLWAIKEGIKTYYSEHFNTMIKNAMQSDYSWNNSAKKYKELYENLLKGEQNNEI